MIQRKLAAKLSQLIKNKEEFNNVLLVEGARQVGKTTLVRQVLGGLELPYREINLEEERELAEKIDLCENFSQLEQLIQLDMKFRSGGSQVLFIDEAQESRRLGGFVRFFKEKWPHTQVILSGSVLSRLFRDNVRYPVGRVTTLHLQPFSFEEFLMAKKEEALLEMLKTAELAPLTHERLLKLLSEYVEVGGLPEVVTHYERGLDWRQKREMLLLGYYSDFKRVFGEEKQAYFKAALRATASLLGAPFKNSAVAHLLDGGKNKTIIDALGQLEAWKMIFRAEQRGPSVETSFHPKRYLFDLGIAKQLREMAIPGVSLLKTQSMDQRTPVGGLIENLVAQVLMADQPELSGWKKATSGSEVDFIVKQSAATVLPIECKAAYAIKNSHLGGVRDFMRRHKVTRGMVVAMAPLERRRLSRSEEMVILPLYLMERWQEILG